MRPSAELRVPLAQSGVPHEGGHGGGTAVAESSGRPAAQPSRLRVRRPTTELSDQAEQSPHGEGRLQGADVLGPEVFGVGEGASGRRGCHAGGSSLSCGADWISSRSEPPVGAAADLPQEAPALRVATACSPRQQILAWVLFWRRFHLLRRRPRNGIRADPPQRRDRVVRLLRVDEPACRAHRLLSFARDPTGCCRRRSGRRSPVVWLPVIPSGRSRPGAGRRPTGSARPPHAPVRSWPGGPDPARSSGA